MLASGPRTMRLGVFDMYDICVINTPIIFTNRVIICNNMVNALKIYTTKGRDRFHLAATPLKPHKVGNICYMTYRYGVLYFLNLSLKHFFPHRKRQSKSGDRYRSVF